MVTKKRERTSELPELIKDPVLGTLRFSAALDDTDEYQTKLVLDGSRVTIDLYTCLLYTSPSPRDQRGSRMPSSA